VFKCPSQVNALDYIAKYKIVRLEPLDYQWQALHSPQALNTPRLKRIVRIFQGEFSNPHQQKQEIGRVVARVNMTPVCLPAKPLRLQGFRTPAVASTSLRFRAFPIPG
jgi:hypothetical protein